MIPQQSGRPAFFILARHIRYGNTWLFVIFLWVSFNLSLSLSKSELFVFFHVVVWSETLNDSGGINGSYPLSPPSFRNKLKQYLSSLNPLPVIDRPDSRNFEIKFRLVFFFFGLYYELLASRFLNPSRLSGERYWIQIIFNWHPHSMFDY
jgi:hypothetical protein